MAGYSEVAPKNIAFGKQMLLLNNKFFENNFFFIIVNLIHVVVML